MSLVHLLRWYWYPWWLGGRTSMLQEHAPCIPLPKKKNYHLGPTPAPAAQSWFHVAANPEASGFLAWPGRRTRPTAFGAGTSKVEVVSVFDILRYWIILRWVGKKCTVWLVHGELPRNLWWPSNQVLFLLGRRRGRVSIDWNAAVVRLSIQDLNFMHNWQ